MAANQVTLRKKLLRFLLIPLALLFVVDATGSYFIATRVSEEVYDRELVEIARELLLHVVYRGAKLEFELPREIEHTLLTDQDDKIYFAVHNLGGNFVAGESALPQPEAQPAGEVTLYDGMVRGEKIRVALLRSGTGTGSIEVPAEILVAETLVKRHILTQKIVFG